MWSTRKRSSGTRLGHDKRNIPAFDTVLFQLSLRSLQRKYLSNIPTDKIVLSSELELSKRPSEICYWWLKIKERKLDFRFVERIFFAAINCTGSAEGALVPVFLRITHWTKSGLPVSPPGLFPPWLQHWSANFERASRNPHFDFRLLFTSYFRSPQLAETCDESQLEVSSLVTLLSSVSDRLLREFASPRLLKFSVPDLASADHARIKDSKWPPQSTTHAR